MRDAFAAYYLPTDRAFKELWDEGTLVLDASALLGLYRLPLTAREAVLGALDKLSARLWVPFQAALEYQANRLAVIAAVTDKYCEADKAMDHLMNTFGDELAKLKLLLESSGTNAKLWSDELRSLLDKVLHERDPLQEALPDINGDDAVRNRLDALLESRIGSPPASQHELDKINDDGKKRYALKVPPGWADTKSKMNQPPHVFNTLILERQYGDLYLWYQVIEHAMASKLKNLVLITDDRKEDWWWRVDRAGTKTLGPRPELRQEIAAKAGVRLFWMYNTDSFLERAKQYLGLDVSAETIERVRETNLVVGHTDYDG